MRRRPELRWLRHRSLVLQAEARQEAQVQGRLLRSRAQLLRSGSGPELLCSRADLCRSRPQLLRPGSFVRRAGSDLLCSGRSELRRPGRSQRPGRRSGSFGRSGRSPGSADRRCPPEAPVS
jgi:hypothetical protein